MRNGLLGKTRATFEEAKVLLEIGAPLRLLSSASTEGGMLEGAITAGIGSGIFPANKPCCCCIGGRFLPALPKVLLALLLLE